MNDRKTGEVVELTRDCDLGCKGERAVVVLDESALRYMTLIFVDREPLYREVNTGTDYRYLRRI